ncbi:hypothetical protein K1719_000788 [Acacia pycnantha]|nr:hypothetical protein K1719_000788 [Acacia pycnantha]
MFAEATKELIDLLFNLFRMPIGTFTSLITEKGMVGSIGKFYKSIEILNAREVTGSSIGDRVFAYMVMDDL